MTYLFNKGINYINKCKLLGIEPLDITYDEETDTYKLNSLNLSSFENDSSDTIVIDIPDFITDLNIKSFDIDFIQEDDDTDSSIIKSVNQSRTNNKNIIFNWQSFNGKSTNAMFINLEAKSLTVNINIENIEDMSESFRHSHIEKLIFKNTDTKNLKNIRQMFQDAYIDSMNFNEFNLSNVEDASCAFTDSTINCEIKLKNMINVRDIRGIFSHARIYNINTAEINLKHIESMSFAFFNTYTKMKSTIDLSKCDLSNLISAKMVFAKSNNIITLNIGEWSNLKGFEDKNRMFMHSSIENIKVNEEN